MLDPLWCAPRAPEEVEADLRGERIAALGRRGKYLVLELEDERFLVMHLRMTGNLLWVDPTEDDAGPSAPARAPGARRRPAGCCSWTCGASAPAS